MVTAALTFVATSCAIAALFLLLGRDRGAVAQLSSDSQTKPAPPGVRKTGRSGPAGPPGRPGRLLWVLIRAGRMLRPSGAPPDLRARLEAAGQPAGLGVRELMAAKVAAAALAGAAALPLAAFAPGRLGLVLAPAGAVGGFLGPDVWLGRLAAARARRVRRDLPAFLDMLRATVEAGGSVTSSLRAVSERTSGPLAREWRAVAEEVALGVPLAEALDALAARLPQAEIRAVLGALDRARRHGAPLGDTLAAQASAARFALARRIREDAARAGPKIQLVVALLLVPSVLLLVAAALLSAFLDGDTGALAL
jgi:tight adherence protein C